MDHLKMFTDYFKIYHAPFFSSCGDIFLVNFLTILKRKWAQFERKDEIMMIWDSLFAHNFYLIKKLAIIEIAEAFSQSISWGGLDRVLCIRKSEWGRKIIGTIANARSYKKIWMGPQFLNLQLDLYLEVSNC